MGKNIEKSKDKLEMEYLENRFGGRAVKRGFITPKQLVEALDIQQREKIENGKQRFIGRILLEQGLISITQIDEVLESMGKGPALG